MTRQRLNYKYVATTLEGFIQQTAVGYIARGYFFYVTGCVPARIAPAAHDERLLAKFGVAQSKWSRYRRKLRTNAAGRRSANVQYVRYRDFWVLLATAGEHHFFQEHQKPQAKSWVIERQYRDVREVPITFGGYSISWRESVSVRISPQAYRELKAYFLHLAAKETKDSLEWEFRRAPFEPYGGVTRQMFAILRAVNRVRRTAGLPLVPRGSIRVRRRVVKPFADTGNGFFNEESLRLAA